VGQKKGLGSKKGKGNNVNRKGPPLNRQTAWSDQEYEKGRKSAKKWDKIQRKGRNDKMEHKKGE